MNYPLISEYIEAIKAAEDNFEQLKNLCPVLGEDEMPVFSGGNFAVVFKMKDEQTGKSHAVKCFLREQEGRAEAYRMIAEELEYVNSTFLTPIKYLDKELFVDTGQTDETEFPVLLMDWVEGVTLDKYIRENIYDKYALSMLAYQFSRLAMWLIPQPFAHGDLKPDNILVKDDGTLVLVDYDGMYVPAMKGQKARELGSPDFRHPSRTETDFDEHIDDFSLASILLSLKAIALQSERLEEYGASDRLLFSAEDYRHICQCELLKALFPSDDSEINVLTSLFMIALEKKNLSNVSFRLFDLCRPKEPEYVNLSTEVTDEDLANAWTDEFGAKYSKDGKRLLKCDNHNIKEYTIKPSTIVICEFAFPLSYPYENDYGFSDYCPYSKIHIPDSVTKIGDKAFFGCSSLSEIHIPDSVTSIGKSAFFGCSSLKEIHIPDSVTGIGECAFSGCGKLKSIILSNYISKISSGAFAGCEQLLSIDIPQSVTSIGSSAFESCSGLESILIPENVTSIGIYAFCGCKRLIKINIPSGITIIRSSTFQYCSGLTSFKIPESVTNIDNDAFKGCNSLKSIVIPKGVLSIGTSVFSWCNDLTSIIVDKSNEKYDSRNKCNAIIKSETDTLIAGCPSTVIPNTVKAIGFGAFEGCRTIESIIIPHGISTIGDYAFKDCSLTSIIIPESVTCIGYCAFESCDKLEIISLPGSLTSIGDLTFRDCKSLKCISIPNGSYEKFKNLLPDYQDLLHEEILSTEVTDEDLANAWTDEFGVKYSKDRKRLLKCYNPTAIKDYSIKPGTIVICDRAFINDYFWRGLMSIQIPNSVTHIGDYAFSICKSLTEIHIPDSVTSIGDGAFSGCKSLTGIHIPESVTSIGDGAFGGCYHVTSIHVEEGSKHFNSHNNCNAVIETQKNKLIVGCASTIIPESVTSIGNYAFVGCESLKKIHIPDSVTEIDNWAFSECSSLTEIYISNSVTKIGERAFFRCCSLTEIHISESVTSIGNHAFERCSSLTEIRIPNSVTEIGNWAFSNCSSLTKIYIPDSVTSIRSGVFSGSFSLSQIVIPSGTRSKFEDMLPKYKEKLVEVDI